MRKRLLFIFTFLILFSLKINNAYALENITVWMECNYDVYKDDEKSLETNSPIALVSGAKFQSDFLGAASATFNLEPKEALAYRLLQSDLFSEKYNGDISYSTVPYFDGCWFINSSDIGKKCTSDKNDSLKYSEEEALKMLINGTCPSIIRKCNDGKKCLVFAGTSQSNYTQELSKQYRFYKQNESIIAEGYSNNGVYLVYKDGERIETDLSTTGSFTYVNSVFDYINLYGRDFTKIAEHNTSIFENSKIIFDSNNNIQKLNSVLDNWYNNYGDKSTLNSMVSEYNNLINSCNNLNNSIKEGKDYTFSQSYSASTMLNQLDSFLTKFKEDYNTEGNGYPMCIKEENTPYPDKSAYNCSMQSLLGDLSYIPKQLEDYIYQDVQSFLDAKGMDTNVNYDDTISTLTYCSVNLDKNADKFGLSSSQTSKIRENYENFARENNFNIVYDCESLLGENLTKKIESYVNIIKIAIPIILIALGIVDFAKATFAGDEEKMKTAQKQFIKRILVAILIFLVPTFVKLLLSIANKVWINISPDGCGIF